MLNSALYKEISFLDQESAEALITDPVEGVYLPREDAIQQILEVTSGHAYYTQVLCHALFARHAGSATELTAADVHEVLPSVIEHSIVNLKHTWDASSLAEKLMLLILVELTKQGRRRVVSERDVASALKKYGLPLLDTQIRQTLRELVNREVLGRIKGSSYRFTIELVRQWVDQNQRLDWLRDEYPDELQALQAAGVEPVPQPVGQAGQSSPRLRTGRTTSLSQLRSHRAFLALALVLIGAVLGARLFLPNAGSGSTFAETLLPPMEQTSLLSIAEAYQTGDSSIGQAEVILDGNRCVRTSTDAPDGEAQITSCITRTTYDSESQMLQVFVSWVADTAKPGMTVSRNFFAQDPRVVLEDGAGEEQRAQR